MRAHRLWLLCLPFPPPPRSRSSYQRSEYIEYTRDANDLIELARMSRTNGGGPAAVQDYLERAIFAAKGAGKALDRMVPLLPRGGAR